MGLSNFNRPESRHFERSQESLRLSFFLSFGATDCERLTPPRISLRCLHEHKKTEQFRPAKKNATCSLYFCTSSPQILSSSCAGENPTNVCPSAVRSTFTRTSASVSEPDFRSVAIVLNASEYTRVTR